MSDNERQVNSSEYSMFFRMISSVDKKTGMTNLSPLPVVELSKDCGVYSVALGAVTEIGYGFYKLAANSTDRNTLGALQLRATAVGCEETHKTYVITAHNPFDGTRLGLSALPNANVGELNGLPIVDGFGNVSIDESTIPVTPPTDLGPVLLSLEGIDQDLVDINSSIQNLPIIPTDLSGVELALIAVNSSILDLQTAVSNLEVDVDLNPVLLEIEALQLEVDALTTELQNGDGSVNHPFTVEYSDGRPGIGAFVEVYNSESVKIIDAYVTSLDGVVTFKLNPGTYRFDVSAPGLDMQSVTEVVS